MLPTNENLLDRSIRVVVGLFVISLYFWGPQTAWAWIGLIPLVTGLVGTCPAYMVLGLRTCPLKKTSPMNS